jgi:hypothetical protein
MMISHPWRSVPLFRIALPFVAGICFGFAFPDDFLRAALGSILSVILPGIIVFILGATKFRFYVFQGVLLQLIMALQGFSSVVLTREDLRPDHYSRRNIEKITVRLLEDVAWKGKRYRTLASIEVAAADSLQWNVDGKVLLYFKDSIAASRLHCGDRLKADVLLHSLPLPKKEGDFNYKLFMERRQVYSKAVIKKFELLPVDRINVIDYAFECRRILLEQLARYLHGQ